MAHPFCLKCKTPLPKTRMGFGQCIFCTVEKNNSQGDSKMQTNLPSSKGRFSRDPFSPQNPWLNKPKSSVSLPVVVGVLVVLLVAGIAMIQISKPGFRGEVPYRKLLKFSAIVTDTKSNPGGNGFLIDKKNKFLMTHFDCVNKGDFHIVYFPHHDQGVLETDLKKYYRDEKKFGIPGKVVYRNMEKDIAILELDRVPADMFDPILAGESPSTGADLFSLVNEWKLEVGSVRQVYYKEIGTPGEPGRIFKGMVIETQTRRMGMGAPIINKEGKLIGMLSKFDHKEVLVGFEIDITEIRQCLDQFYAQIGINKQ